MPRHDTGGREPDTDSESTNKKQPTATEPAGEMLEPEAEVEQLRVELAHASDRTLRLQAELENLRKRTAREAADQLRYAALPLLRDLLAVLDNIERAIEAAEKAPHADGGLLDGVRLVRQQLETVLGQHNCRPIEALDKPFDPHQHEAISQQPSPDKPPGTILHVVRAGYRLHDRVVRPSQVIVASTQPPEQAGSEESP